ncbi:MAG: response regulator [bacterium]
MRQQPGSDSGPHGLLPAIRTLVLDDNSFDRKRICRLGGGIGLPLVFDEASSVETLKQCLDRQAYDLFLIDYVMPGGDGLAALEIIRNHARQRDAASIMISGSPDTRVAVSALKNGCHDFIVKEDMSMEVLQKSVLTALNNARNLARQIDQPKQVMDVEDMRSLMRLALDDQTIRDIIRAPLEDGLQAAARMVGVGWGLQMTPDIQQFLIDFTKEDEFEFR